MCRDISWMGYQSHVMRCVGRRGKGEAMGIRCGVLKEAIPRMKDANKAMSWNSTVDDKRKYKTMTKEGKERSLKNNEIEGYRDTEVKFVKMGCLHW